MHLKNIFENEPYSRIWSCSFHESRIGRDIENKIKVDAKARPNLHEVCFEMSSRASAGHTHYALKSNPTTPDCREYLTCLVFVPTISEGRVGFEQCVHGRGRSGMVGS